MSITALLSDFAVCAGAATARGKATVAATTAASWQLADKRKMQRKKLNAYFTNTNDKQGSCCCCYCCLAGSQLGNQVPPLAMAKSSQGNASQAMPRHAKHSQAQPSRQTVAFSELFHTI